MDLLLQLPLSVQLRDEATFANFLPGPNRTLLGLLCQEDHLEHTSLEKFVYIHGSTGTGRTHLLQAACHEAHYFQQNSIYLPMSEFVYQSPKLLEGVEHLDLICIDDIQELAESEVWEESIFHLFNRIRDTGSRLLISGSHMPSQLNIELQDLVSRLSWGVVMQVHPLVDAEKRQALRLRAHLRGLDVSDEVARYILKQCARDMHKMFDVLSELDNASLRAKRKLSIPFVKKILN